MRGDTTFESLLAAARSGAPAAWEDLYRAFAPKVLGYLRARSARDPDDLAGEVFVQVVRDLDRFEGDERAFRAWLFTITHNRMLDDARARSRRPETIGAEEIVLEPGGDVEEEALAAMSEQRILRMLRVLSEEQQAVLLLRLFGGLTVPQVAGILGKTDGAVKAAQHRAFQTLRGVLESERIVREPGHAMHQ
ncbi:MAG: RNA polymerase sigma factor, partial [Actinomycetota bacterium]